MKTAPLIALTLLPFLILAARADDALPATAQVSDPVPGHGDVTYFDLLAQMVLTLNHTEATAPATYNWDAKVQSFVTKSKEFDRLAKENEALKEQE